jgi:hypothetical protein
MGIVSSLIKAINAIGDSRYGSADGQYMGYNIYPLNKSHNRPQSESEKRPQPVLDKNTQSEKIMPYTTNLKLNLIKY